MLTQLVYILNLKIKSRPDVKFCAHAHCVLPQCSSLQSSSIAITDGTHCDIVSFAQTLKLVVPSSVRECPRKNEAISNRARHDVIKSSHVILQAIIGRESPSQSEFEVCTQRIVVLLPELKDPIPPIRQDAFKPWVCAWLSVRTCSILFGILIV